jgi:glycosyltransferase involved in cell wall biosynthesis
MRIVHLTASTFFGGPERQMLGLATALPDPYSTTFLSFSEGGRCRAFLSQARSCGLDAAELVHDTPHFRGAMREIAAFLRGNQTDVLVTHGYKSNLLGRPAARAAGIPTASVARGWTGEDWKVRCYEALDRFHLRYMDRVVCVSAAQADRVRACGVPPEQIRVIRNAVQLSGPPMLAAKERLRALAGGGGPVVLAAGRLSPEKGFHVLVEAAVALLGRCPTARVVVCGEGVERPRLERRLSELGIADRVWLPGFRDDLNQLIPWADLVVLPSLTEGLPNVALEAAAAGVPVVATAVGGTPEVMIDGETSYLVPPADPAALADRIGDLLDDPAKARMFGTAGRSRVEKHFSFEAQARAYELLFAELRPRRAGSRAEVTCVS